MKFIKKRVHSAPAPAPCDGNTLLAARLVGVGIFLVGKSHLAKQFPADIGSLPVFSTVIRASVTF